MNRGLFITFEGGEGSGKSSVIKKLIAELEGQFPLLLTREPGGTKISEEIRNIILDKDNTDMDYKTEALLYCASRRQHLVEKVIPALEKNISVISDRYLDSSLVYQGYARGLGIDDVLSINMFAIENCIPDITFLFCMKPEVGLKRIASSSREVNRLDLEKLDFHKKVHDGYMALAERFSDRIFKVDAEKPFEEVYEQVQKKMLEKLKEHYE